MKADLELVITHDGQGWLARNEAVVASGATLPELDASLAAALGERDEFAGRRVTVFMGFDFDTMPTWMRQYASHYFNRYVRLDIKQRSGVQDAPPQAGGAV